jgi:hypothetical protein
LVQKVCGGVVADITNYDKYMFNVWK